MYDGEIRSCVVMPYDAVFWNADGREELCHATGVEIYFAKYHVWLAEYEDSLGDYHYM